jgi:hypothetical protein
MAGHFIWEEYEWMLETAKDRVRGWGGGGGVDLSGEWGWPVWGVQVPGGRGWGWGVSQGVVAWTVCRCGGVHASFSVPRVSWEGREAWAALQFQ